MNVTKRGTDGDGKDVRPFRGARLADARDELDAAGVVRRGLREVAGQHPADVRDAAVVAGGRAAAARRGRGRDEVRAVVVGVEERESEAGGAEVGGGGADFEVGVGGQRVGDDEAARGASADVRSRAACWNRDGRCPIS